MCLSLVLPYLLRAMSVREILRSMLKLLYDPRILDDSPHLSQLVVIIRFERLHVRMDSREHGPIAIYHSRNRSMAVRYKLVKLIRRRWMPPRIGVS